MRRMVNLPNAARARRDERRTRVIATMTMLVALSAAPASSHAQVRSTATRQGMVTAVRPRTYTPEQLLARMRSLPGSGAKLMTMSGPGTGGGSGATFGAVGTTLTLSPSQPGRAGQIACLSGRSLNVVMTEDGQFKWTVVRSSSVQLQINPPGGSTPQSWVVLFDLDRHIDQSSVVVSVTEATGQSTVSCTDAQLDASLANGVESCAITVTDALQSFLVRLAVPDVAIGVDVVDVSVMRVR